MVVDQMEPGEEPLARFIQRGPNDVVANVE